MFVTLDDKRCLEFIVLGRGSWLGWVGSTDEGGKEILKRVSRVYGGVGRVFKTQD
jgi:hypothetical protein